MSKELEDLSRRVSNLEKQLGKSNLFGASQNTIGSTSADLTLKTSGKIKIQWKNKYIDLIKDGKLNVNSKFIYLISNVSDIGNKDGIYITNDYSVYLKAGDSVVNLSGEIGTTYVSYMNHQQTSSAQKDIALKNIGFLYDSIESVDESAIQNGIIYIQNQHKLYLMINGVLQEMTLDIPNPISRQITIQKVDNNQGAIVIKGTGTNNSLLFDYLEIYNDENSSYIDVKNNLKVLVEEPVIDITKEKTKINNGLSVNNIQSANFDTSYGFQLSLINGISTLTVDNIIERNRQITLSTDVIPSYFSSEVNTITSVIKHPDLETGLVITLKYNNQYNVGDYLYTYAEVNHDNSLQLVKLTLEVLTIDPNTTNTIYVNILSQYSNGVSNLDEISNLVGKLVFLISSNNQIEQIKYSKNNIDSLQYNQFLEEQNPNSIKSRIGNLTDLNLKVIDNQQEISMQGIGMFSQTGIFKELYYTSDSILSTTDNSTKMVSTEWIHRLLPQGSIIMFNGTTQSIPNGWKICDGTENTPNLTNYFVRADTNSGNTQTYEVVLNDQLQSNQNILQLQTYSLIFIMKMV